MIRSDARYETKNDIRFLKFGVFDSHQNEVLAVFSTRTGGVSEGYFSSLNLSFAVGDKKENVIENYRLFSEAIGIDYKKLVFSDQQHHDDIRIVTKDDIGKGIAKEMDYRDIDGLITNIPGVPIVTSHADCASIFMYDPCNKVIGLAHAGWRGTVLEIARKMTDKFTKCFGTDPNTLLAAIGPAICGDCYQVGHSVYDEFTKMSIDAGEYIKKREEYYPDIALINRKLLIGSGVKPDNITISSICTMQNPDIFFSHRGQKGKRGGNAAIMQLRQN